MEMSAVSAAGSSPQIQCTAFNGPQCVASGDLEKVVAKAKQLIDRAGAEGCPVLIFNDATGAPIDVDFRGTREDVMRQVAAMTGEAPGETMPTIAEARPRGPGRPKLGVVAREVTLLPRHWEWLNGQPGGASVALRRLVEEARRTHAGRDRARQAQEAAYRFMSAMAGNEPGYEEALRALYRGDEARFDEMTAPWPADVRAHARKLAATVFRGTAV
jgi:hypothetical protein